MSQLSVEQVVTQRFPWAGGVEVSHILGVERPKEFGDMPSSKAAHTYAQLFANYLNDPMRQPHLASAIRKWLNGEQVDHSSWATAGSYWPQFYKSCGELKEALGHKAQKSSVAEAVESLGAAADLLVEAYKKGLSPWTTEIAKARAARLKYTEEVTRAATHFTVLKEDGWSGPAFGKFNDAFLDEGTKFGELGKVSQECAEEATEARKDSRAVDVSVFRALAAAISDYTDALDAVGDSMATTAEAGWKWARADAVKKMEKLISAGRDLSSTPIPEEVRNRLEAAGDGIEITKVALLQVKAILGALSPVTLGISGVVAAAIGLIETIAEPAVKHALAKSCADLNTVLALAGSDVRSKKEEGLERLETGHEVAHIAHLAGDATEKWLDVGAKLAEESAKESLEAAAHTMGLILGPAGQILNSAGYILRIAKEPGELERYATEEHCGVLREAIKAVFTLRGGVTDWTDGNVIIVHEFGNPATVTLGDKKGKLYTNGFFDPDDKSAGFIATCKLARRNGWDGWFQNERDFVQDQNGYNAIAEVKYDTPGGWSLPGFYTVNIHVGFDGDITCPDDPWPYKELPYRTRYLQTSIEYDAAQMVEAYEAIANQLTSVTSGDAFAAHPYWNFTSIEEVKTSSDMPRMWVLKEYGSNPPKGFSEWLHTAQTYHTERTKDLA